MNDPDTTALPQGVAAYRPHKAPPWTRLDLVAFALGLLFFASQAWLFQHKLDTVPLPVLTDFNDYHVVGGMVADGRASEAYLWPALKAEQIAQTRNWSFMPWAYPPQFTLFTAILGVLPIWAAYMLFIGGSWLLFYTALRRLVGSATVLALILTLPAVIINGKCGQSGFLSAGLIGWFLVGLRARSTGAGWPLGMMIFKPHLAAGIGLLALVERKWGVIVRAAALVVALTIAATVLFGPAIWASFREGTDIAGRYLWAGDYPLERMTTVFAALHRFGVPPVAAMVIHLGFAFAVILVLLVSWRRGVERDLLFALAICVSLTASPYTYDYDNVALALVAGLLLPRFVARASAFEALLALFLCWVSTANYLWIGLRQIWYGVPTITADMRLWTVSPFSLAAVAMLTFMVLRRPARTPAPWTWLYIRFGGSLPA